MDGSGVSAAADLVDALTATAPDFPRPGVLFRDLTPVLADATALRAVTAALLEPFRGGFDLVAGIEARGFLLAGAAAAAAGTGVLAVRKAGKLPPPTAAVRYDLEYGSAVLELRREPMAGTRVLVLDDVLATGGTAAAACALLEERGAEVVGVAVVLELAGLGGRGRLRGRRLAAVRVVD